MIIIPQNLVRLANKNIVLSMVITTNFLLITAILMLSSCKKEETVINASAIAENVNSEWVVKINLQDTPKIDGLIRFTWKIDNSIVEYFGVVEFPKKETKQIIYRSSITAFKAETAKVVYLLGKSFDNQVKIVQK